ncbi:MAG: BirA family transcriptional regulator [Bacteroidota bacterium]|nr:BirA family transcriptional regulator [Bacteroidota bacterium]
MYILTDSIDFARKYYPELIFNKISNRDVFQSIKPLADKIFNSDSLMLAVKDAEKFWNYALLSEKSEHSQYDILVEQSGSALILTSNIICISGESKALHGFRSRHWVGLPGNIHLSVYLKPNVEIENFAAGFIMLAALAAFKSINDIKSLREKPSIKWVNDVMIGDSKVCGVLANTQIMGNVVSGAVLGIGINVESSPQPEPTKFVPKAACINGFLNYSEKVTQGEIFQKLIRNIQFFYSELVRGDYQGLLNIYRINSLAIGRKVRIWSDPIGEAPMIIREGEVIKIGEMLELYLSNKELPITSGRLEIITQYQNR